MNSFPTLLILNNHQLPILFLLIIQCLKVLIKFLFHTFILKVPPNLFNDLSMYPSFIIYKYSLNYSNPLFTHIKT